MSEALGGARRSPVGTAPAAGSVGKLVKVAARAAAMLVGVGLAIYPSIAAGRLAAPTAIAVLGLALLAVAVIGKHRAAWGPSLLLLLIGYATWLWTGDGGTDGGAPLVAAGLFLLMELVEVVFMIDRAPARDVLILRGQYVATVAVAGLLVSSAAMLVGDLLTTARALPLAVAGVSAITAIGIGVLLARRSIGS